MANTIDTTVSIDESLFAQAEALAQRLGVSQNHLFELALAHFIHTQSSTEETGNSAQPGEKRPAINQGDVYWLRPANPDGLEAGIPHPHVVIQYNLLNHSRLNTVVVCSLTSNIRRVNMPGNILLEAGEASLPRQSVVEVSKVASVDKSQLGEYIGTLSEQRINQILAGMRFLQTSFYTSHD